MNRMSGMNILFSTTLGISALLIALLMKQLRRNPANTYLVILLCTVSIGCLYSLYLSHTTNIHIIALANALPALFGPLIFLYIKKSLHFNSSIKWPMYLLYFSPFILAFSLSYWANSHPSDLLLDFLLNVFTKILLSLAFIIATYILLKKHSSAILNTFSNIESIEFNWFSFIVKTAILIFSIYLILMGLTYFDITLITDFENITAVLIFIFIVPISYFGIANSNTFYNLSTYGLLDAVPSDTAPSDPIDEAQKELMSYDKLETIGNEIRTILAEEKLFLDENLTIEDLARRVNIHSKYLSYAINKKFGKSFFELINQYRVAAFNEKILMPENKHFTFLSIAFECGFGSKSAFNRAYKKEMNCSPSEYLKENTPQNTYQ